MKHPASGALVTVCLALCTALACNPPEDDTHAHSDGAGGSSEGGSGGQSSEPDSAGGSAGVMGATSGGGVDTGAGGEPGDDGEDNEDGCSIPETPGDLPVCSDQFTMTVTCLSGPCVQQVYIHTYDVTWTGFQFSGTGIVTESGTTFTESICGSVSDGELTFHAVYTTVAAGYTIDGTGTLAEDKTASGLSQGFDPRGATQQLGFEVSPLSVGCE